MKKLILGTLIMTGILGAFFYQKILATIDFYQYQEDNSETFAQATINWKQIPFSSNMKSGFAGNPIVFHSLQIPITFQATIINGNDSSFAFGGAQSITVTYSSVAADFFNMYNFSDHDKKTTCGFLAKTSGLGACTSNYNFYRALLELNETDIHFFTNLEGKSLYNKLLPIRADTIPSNTISGFETKRLQGFIFTDSSGDYTVELFDSENQQYHLELTNLSQAELAFVLSNIKLVQ